MLCELKLALALGLALVVLANVIAWRIARETHRLEEMKRQADHKRFRR